MFIFLFFTLLGRSIFERNIFFFYFISFIFFFSFFFINFTLIGYYFFFGPCNIRKQDCENDV
ncbi:hypothetical protein A9Q91_00750 [Candidatus Gracilibacteria bacterium 28_42_T64]|nr:hypothetical protein A9Q91_00750 [Candidatus Gracilibacteria bacterium 28_42_T64]